LVKSVLIVTGGWRITFADSGSSLALSSFVVRLLLIARSMFAVLGHAVAQETIKFADREQQVTG
jgi:hypothetical protein